MELKEHNQKAYNNLIEMYNSEIDRAAIIHPTGTGKSFIAGQLIQDNPNNKILVIAPTNTILDRYRNMFEENNINASNVKLITYDKLMYMKDWELEALNLDNIILDEFHHCGAKEWSKGVNRLLEANKTSKVLGLSATPIRYLDNLRDMAEELFKGNIASEITLPEAILDGLLQIPEYHQGLISTIEDIERLNKLIEGLTEKDAKRLLRQEFEKVKDVASNVESINQILKQGITEDRKSGRYIVFCKNIKEMKKAMKLASQWFEGINDVELYSVASKDINGKTISRSENKKEIELFENSKSDKAKLMFSVAMLNEGIHVKDIDGVIMLRSTKSPNLYKQLLGRALSIGQTKIPLIFDFANNIGCTEYVYRIKRQMEEITEKRKKDGKDISKQKEKLEKFKIIDHLVEIKEFIKALDDKTFKVILLERIREIKKWMESNDTKNPPSRSSKDEYEKKLANWYEGIVRRIVKPYEKLETDEERKKYKEKYPEFEEIYKIVIAIRDNIQPIYLKNAIEINKWIDDTGIDRKPSPTAKDEEEKTLGRKLANLRNEFINKYLNLETEEEKVNFKKRHPYIDEVIKIVNEIDTKTLPPYLRNAIKINNWASNDNKSPSAASKDAEERKLGKDLSSIRQNLIKPYMSMQTEDEKNHFIEKHPETEKVLDIISNLDLQHGTNKNKELALLIKQDLIVRSTSREAKRLEREYQEELSRKGLIPSSNDKRREYFE